MIRPYQSNQVVSLLADDQRAKEILKNRKKYQEVLVNSAAATNAVMMGSGYFSPLTGYMSLADALKVAEDLHTESGLFWPVPITNRLQKLGDLKVGDEVLLLDPNVEDDPPLALMKIEQIDKASSKQIEDMAAAVFGTKDLDHPGVATFMELGNYFVAGPIEVLNLSYFTTDFPDTFRTAQQIRDEIKERGWEKVVAFQTRNPMQRAHEAICKIAMERLDADGLVIHMLLGKLKPGDVPADVRDNAIRTLVDNYFADNTAMIAGYGFDMLYAGPREAVLHAIFRQNMGATHLIVGRDHAGVGDYYGPFDALEIFQHSVPETALDIAIFSGDHAAYSKKLKKVIMMKDAPEDHTHDDYVIISGTKVRQMLKDGVKPPAEVSRPEVAEILIEWMQSEREK